MRIASKIREVNSILTGDHSSHNYNAPWIAKNTPTPKPGNQYEYLRQDAPFYCSSSLGVMLSYYQIKSDFSGFIDDISERLSATNFPENSLSELVDWIVFQTIDCIVQDKSDKTDLQNVGWSMESVRQATTTKQQPLHALAKLHRVYKAVLMSCFCREKNLPRRLAVKWQNVRPLNTSWTDSAM
jgi:hypothetical protein